MVVVYSYVYMHILDSSWKTVGPAFHRLNPVTCAKGCVSVMVGLFLELYKVVTCDGGLFLELYKVVYL